MTPRLTLAILRLLAVRQHLARGRHVLIGDLRDRTKLPLTLRSLLRQDVVQVRLTALEAAVSFRTEALRGAAIRLQLRHVFLLAYGPSKPRRRPVGRPARFRVRHFVTSTPVDSSIDGRDRSALARRDHHDHLPALELRKLLDGAVLFQILLHAPEKLRPELLVGHLSPPEAQSDLRFVAVTQEPDQVTELDLIVALVRAGPELDLLDLRLLLLLACGLGFLVLLEHELAVVHDPAYGGI